MAEEKKERVAIYIDGSNFYHYLRDKETGFIKGSLFDFKKFSEFLGTGRNCISKRYYTGIFRNFDHSEKSESLVKGQQKFLAHLENDGFIIKRGRIMVDGGKPREKGTDVKIATDLIIGAVDDLYDTAIIVSSDTDLIPALKYVRYKGKKVEYVGFSHFPSLGMQKHVDFSRLLSPSDISNFTNLK
ncbi:MAG: NYN domain-containing protein [Candidatus Vogelbacteria bacterium]|nr:NYN domain-containing protein [Candidatus Vogelbacteria bacterium]